MNKPSENKLSQQRLPGFYPIMRPLKVIIFFLVGGVASIIIGGIIAGLNSQLFYFSSQYKFGEEKLNFTFDVDKDINKPVYIHYYLDGYFQNYQKFLSSSDFLSAKDPEAYPCSEINEKNVAACSRFNDSYELFDGSDAPLNITRDGIAYPSDLTRKDMKNVSEEGIVWLKTAALPTFKKLYGIIKEGLKKGKYVIVVTNNFPLPNLTKKAVMVQTVNAVGGKSAAFGVVYILTGVILIVIGVVFILIELFFPRELGEYHPKVGSDVADTRLTSSTSASTPPSKSMQANVKGSDGERDRIVVIPSYLKTTEGTVQHFNKGKD